MKIEINQVFENVARRVYVPPPHSLDFGEDGLAIFIFVQFKLLRLPCSLKIWLSPPPLTFNYML